MRKILSGLMLLTLTVLFATTLYRSHTTEAVFRAQIDRINQDNTNLLKVKLLNYQRGLLVSEVKTLAHWNQSSLSLQHQIRHFPWKTRLDTRIADNANPDQSQQFQLQTDITLDGKSTNQFNLADLSLKSRGAELQLQGLKFTFELDGAFATGRLNLFLEKGLLVTAEKAELHLSDLSFDCDFFQQLEVQLGRATLNLGDLTVKPSNRAEVTLKGLQSSLTSGLETEQLSSNLHFQLASLQLAGEMITDANLQLAISGLAAADLRSIQATLKQILVGTLRQQINPLVLQLQLFGLYSQLLNEGLSVSLDELSLRSNQGMLQAKGDLSIEAQPTAAVEFTPLEKLTGALQLDVEPPVFNAGFRILDNLQHPKRKNNPTVQNELAEQLAGGLLQKGIFTRRESGPYRLDLSIAQGRFRWDEHPLRR